MGSAKRIEAVTPKRSPVLTSIVEMHPVNGSNSLNVEVAAQKLKQQQKQKHLLQHQQPKTNGVVATTEPTVTTSLIVNNVNGETPV